MPMTGFGNSGPILVKVTWQTPEVSLTNPNQTPEGLRADVVAADGMITRWFAPWTSVTYIRQALSAEESGLGHPDVPHLLVPRAN
jgi:hypothetical protein